MQTVKDFDKILEILDVPHTKGSAWYEAKKDTILSLLSQQEVEVESDEEAAKRAYPYPKFPEMMYSASALHKIKQGCFLDGRKSLRFELITQQHKNNGDR